MHKTRVVLTFKYTHTTQHHKTKMFSLTQTAAAQSVRVTAPKRDVSRRCVLFACYHYFSTAFFFSSSSFRFAFAVLWSDAPTRSHSYLDERLSKSIALSASRDDDDALKKRSEKKRTRLVPLPWSSLRVSFFFASKKETGRRARAPDRGSLTHQCAWVTWHVFLSATF